MSSHADPSLPSLDSGGLAIFDCSPMGERMQRIQISDPEMIKKYVLSTTQFQDHLLHSKHSLTCMVPSEAN